MKVCMTGATGFVGSEVLRTIADAGHDVTVLVRPGSERKLPNGTRCGVVTGDLLKVGDVERALEGVEAVVHLAGIKRREIRRTGLTYEDVDVGSVRVMTAAMASRGLRRIILLSAARIGNSTYVRCKKKAEGIVTEAGLDWTIFRPSFILAPGQEWPRMIQPMLTAMTLLPGVAGDIARRAGNVTRPALARCMAYALVAPETIGTIFDVPTIRETDATRTRESISVSLLT